ncbi:MAG: phosphoribosylformylglycinamidine synthase subunit PurS [Deltaproteobacteria bacterium]
MMLAKVYVTLKNGVLDPQGKAVQHSLESIGHKDVQDVRIGKFIEIKLSDMSKTETEKKVKEMCEKLLANTVIENYRFEIL